MGITKISDRNKLIVLALIIFIIGCFTILYPYRYRIKNKIAYFLSTGKINNSSSAPCESCDQLFSDGINVHQLAYKREGINIQKNSDGLRALESQGVLTRITTNDYYVVRDMNFSDPLLLNEAVELLTKIGRLYRNEIEKAKIKYVPFEVTSATRTIESVDRLRNGNANAIKNSSHLKGKTFDIGYINFAGHPQHRALFIKVLKNVREENICFIKFEVAQKCFHITAN